jgi:hypothetical protein
VLTEEALEKLNLWVFPNPASGNMVLHSSDILLEDLSLMLISTKGTTVWQSCFNRGATQCTLETDTLPNGNYYLTVTDGKRWKVIQVAVERR